MRTSSTVDDILHRFVITNRSMYYLFVVVDMQNPSDRLTVVEHWLVLELFFSDA